MAHSTKCTFRSKHVSIEVQRLVPSRKFDQRTRNHEKYKQIAASIAAIGVIEPLVVFPAEDRAYRVLDGHKRLDILQRNKTEWADCIVAVEDENYTYNRRVNYLSPVSEHLMILRALEHNSEERVAATLNVNVGTIRAKRDLLNGVCKEAAHILKDHRVSSRAFTVLKKMKAIRQVEAAQMMVASGTYSGHFAAALLAGTRDDMLVEEEKARARKPATHELRARLEEETDRLIREMKTVENSYGTDVLTLSVSCKYIARVLANDRVRGEIEEHHAAILGELKAVLASVAADQG